MAEREVRQALKDLELDEEEANPSELWRLRDKIERNLSGLMGPEMARVVVNEKLQLDPKAQTVFAETIVARDGLTIEVGFEHVG